LRTAPAHLILVDVVRCHKAKYFVRRHLSGTRRQDRGESTVVDRKLWCTYCQLHALVGSPPSDSSSAALRAARTQRRRRWALPFTSLLGVIEVLQRPIKRGESF
jgi:hypothetical protein